MLRVPLFREAHIYLPTANTKPCVLMPGLLHHVRVSGSQRAQYSSRKDIAGREKKRERERGNSIQKIYTYMYQHALHDLRYAGLGLRVLGISVSGLGYYSNIGTLNGEASRIFNRTWECIVVYGDPTIIVTPYNKDNSIGVICGPHLWKPHTSI